MVSFTGSQVDSAVLQQVIGSLGSKIEFGADIDVNRFEEDSVSREENRVEDLESSSSGMERTEYSAAGDAISGY